MFGSGKWFFCLSTVGEFVVAGHTRSKGVQAAEIGVINMI
jgi:hypothetical protein